MSTYYNDKKPNWKKEIERFIKGIESKPEIRNGHREAISYGKFMVFYQTTLAEKTADGYLVVKSFEHIIFDDNKKNDQSIVRNATEAFLQVLNEVIKKSTQDNGLIVVEAETNYTKEDEFKGPYPLSPLSRKNIQTSSPLESDKVEKENVFLNAFEDKCTVNGFHYNKDDLVNFHTSVKSGYLTILSGMSGTGKSSIVKLYADALGNCTLTKIPVRPSWTDDSDLLGYYDPMNRKYQCSTDLVDILLEAQGKPERLFLVCLDEMNLARVEHYFSQFLSVLEAPTDEVCELTLYPSGMEPDKNYPPKITIGKNVRFVGTVNIDDTTFNFADKVRDRANIITLQVEYYSFLPTEDSNTNKDTMQDFTTKTYPTKSYNFMDFVKDYDYLEICQKKDLRNKLWNWHSWLQSKASSFGVSPRTARAIGTYLANYPENDRESLNSKALDFQVCQRILTKLHGPAGLLNPILNENTTIQDAANSSDSADKESKKGKSTTLEKLLPINEYPISNAYIQKKREELKTYGYCP